MKLKILPLPSVFLVTLIGLCPAGYGQTDDFNDGNDAGWTRFNPLGSGNFAVVGGVYRMSCPPSPDPGSFGPARVGSLRQGVVYDKFRVAVDLPEWDASVDLSVGILARVQSGAGPGTLSGYAATFNVADGDLGIERVTGEQPSNIGGYAKFQPVAGTRYRMVFAGAGNFLEAHLFAPSDLDVPVASRVVEDFTYARGACGLVAFSDDNAAILGVFDNYEAAEGDPVPLDDFNDGNDVGWTRVNPVGVGSYSFPDGGWRVAAAATPDPGVMGPARAGGVRTGQVLSDFCVACDFGGFDSAADGSVGLLARVSNLGAGTTNGYALTFQTRDGDLEINRVSGEAPQKINAGTVLAALDPGRRYRMVFAGRGSLLLGRVYDLGSPGEPVAVIAAEDAAWQSGLAGLIVFSPTNAAAAAVFDSYEAGPLAGAGLAIRDDGPGTVRLGWSWGAGLCYRVESSSGLGVWEAVSGPVEVFGGRAVLRQPVEGRRFFRLGFGP
jgi:hypothetical protein